MDKEIKIYTNQENNKMFLKIELPNINSNNVEVQITQNAILKINMLNFFKTIQLPCFIPDKEPKIEIENEILTLIWNTK